MHEKRKGPMPDSNEFDRPQPEIHWPMRLDGGKENPRVWRGKISAKLSVIRKRFELQSDEEAREKLEELKQRVGFFYVTAGLKAVVRCIDGRGEEGSPSDKTNLGPQVPGGTAVTSLGYRFAKWKDIKPETTIESDVEEYRSLLTKLGLDYIPGGHEDESNAEHPENTGCGAIDKMLEILKVMGEYDIDDQGARKYLVRDYAWEIAKPYMEKEGFEKAFEGIQVMLQTLNETHFNDRYFQKEESTGSTRFRSGILNKVKEGGRQLGKNTVERLSGEHNEVFLMVNYVTGETFDRDGFSSETGGKAQAFNYDVWVIAQRAQNVFPDDAEKQRTFILTNIMYAIGTAMVLTDGSLELGIRQ
jgi:hypothetical protein